MIRPAKLDDLAWMQSLLAENNLLIDGVEYNDFSGIVLVAEREGEVVGFVQAIPAKPIAWIAELVISRSHQRQGFGVKLLQAIELVLRTQGVTAWACGTSREDVMKQLERYGARPMGQGMMYVRSLA